MNKHHGKITIALASLWAALTVPVLAQSPTTGSPAKPAEKVPANSTTPSTATPLGTAKTAGTVIQVRKDLPGEFSYQFVPRTGEPTAPAPLPAPSGTDSVIALTLPAEMKLADTKLHVLDTGRGNLAALPLVATGVIALNEGSFTYVQSVNIPVQTKGKGVTGAQVTLTSTKTNYRQSVLLQSSDGGVAKFRNVPLGEVTAAVSYGAHPAEKQIKTITGDHPAEGYQWPAIQVDWSDVKTTALAGSSAAAEPSSSGSAAPPATLRGESGATAGTGKPIAAPSGGGFLNGLASLIVSLAVLGGIGYGIFWAYSNGKLKPVFEKLGLQTEPITGPMAGAQPDPFSKPERTPIQPITEGTADPLSGGGFSGGGTATAVVGYEPVTAVSTGPRLVGTAGVYAGSVFPVSGASLEIGRDTTNAAPLPNDANTSRRHATIQANGGQYTVMDNGSSNGTYVNGVRIADRTPQPLRSGDEVQIGQTRFRFEA